MKLIGGVSSAGEPTRSGRSGATGGCVDRAQHPEKEVIDKIFTRNTKGKHGGVVGFSSSIVTVAQLLDHAVADLAAAGIAEARIDAEILLGYCLDTTRTGIYLAAREPVDSVVLQRFRELLERRVRREPLAYIVGEKEFWSLSFQVTPAVLIPRPETEFVLETVLARRSQAATNGRCLDLCCGSGVIGIVLARECGLPVIGVDLSAKALAVASKNCLRHRVADRVALVQGDLLSCFRFDRPFSLIVSNPPYVAQEELAAGLEPEVRCFEPHLALDGGPSGLTVIAAISRALPPLLAAAGDCFLEIGAQQGDAVRALFDTDLSAGIYREVTIIKDYSGRDRIAHIRKH